MRRQIIIENYNKPTPKIWRKVSGLAIVSIPVVIAAIENAPNTNPILEYWLIQCFSLCAVTLHFFAETKTEPISE